MTAFKRNGKRLVIGLIGGVVLLIGLVMIPYPGPGWLVVFAGLGILASEFDWADRLLKGARGKYDEWQNWLSRQSLGVRAIFWVLTCVVVILTIWLVNGYGLINDALGLNLDWVRSPFVK